MADKKTILIIGSGLEGKVSMLLAKLENKHTEILTVPQARERGIDISEEVEKKLNEITEVPEFIPEPKTFKFEMREMPLIQVHVAPEITGKQILSKQEKRHRQKHINKLHNQKFRR